ncbi:MAG: class I SAM-dependent methyltransferase [Candidatus Thorarchaeota archaeon]|jgi:ubiquinone/menaquinone biosynthesis C-methylase UbiE
MSRVETEIQKISLKRLDSEGLILDVGGGGEGLVSRIEKQRVCAVDIRMSEIREAQIHGAPANWLVGDGSFLSFRDRSFDVVTLWFSLGYMREWTIKRKVLEEAQRVLKKQGTISIMASKIPDSTDQFVFWALFTLPDGTVSQTGYGVRGGQGQTMEKVRELIAQLDFNILDIEDHGEWFSITASRS